MSTDMADVNEIILKEVIRSLSEKLMAYYIFPDIAEEICTHLRKYFEDGAYKDVADGKSLALALTTHIREINQDKHLQVRWYAEPLPDHEGSMLSNRVKVEELKQRAKLENYGIYRVERLSGNIGYIDIRYFYRTSWGSGETIVAAMNFLANMNAAIVDLRKCRGGHPGTVALISSYFFDREPVHLNSLYWREKDVTEQYWTLPYVPGTCIVDQPVYILTSKGTFSGGEEFSYNLQARRRAILVGEITAGGAHPGSPYRLHSHFEAFIPNGRTINPVTGQNWEGIGVQPDISTPQDQALKVAHNMALRSIIESNNELETNKIPDFLLNEVNAALLNTEDT
jgi:C-terminal processing protease CtpA/Prc